MRLDAKTLRRIWSKVRKCGQCRIWTGGLAGKGKKYPYVWYNGQMVGAHRLVYGHYVGTIPVLFDVHHTCPDTRCIVPHHLQAVAPKNHRAGKRWKHRITDRGHAVAV